MGATNDELFSAIIALNKDVISLAQQLNKFEKQHLEGEIALVEMLINLRKMLADIEQRLPATGSQLLPSFQTFATPGIVEAVKCVNFGSPASS